MNLEQAVYALPSTQALLTAIADDADSGVVVVFIPDNVSRENGWTAYQESTGFLVFQRWRIV